MSGKCNTCYSLNSLFGAVIMKVENACLSTMWKWRNDCITYVCCMPGGNGFTWKGKMITVFQDKRDSKFKVLDKSAPGYALHSCLVHYKVKAKCAFSDAHKKKSSKFKDVLSFFCCWGVHKSKIQISDLIMVILCRTVLKKRKKVLCLKEYGWTKLVGGLQR